MLQAASKLPVALTTAIALVVAFLGIRYAMAKTRVLEFEDVAQYSLSVNPATGIPETISGLCFRSMYCVSDVTTRTNGRTLVVLVRIGACGDGRSGNFSYALAIGDHIQELRFGTKQRLLWTRAKRNSAPGSQ